VALIEAGADVNRPVGAAGYTPLMLAVVQHSKTAAQVLLKRGADVNARNRGGITALMIAAAADQPELVRAAGPGGCEPRRPQRDR